jgi:ethanolamine utilization protein EutN
MRIADVVGTVTLNSVHPTMTGFRFKLATPLHWDALFGRDTEPLEEVVVLDQLGADVGHRIAISEGREAAMPFHPEPKPVDAYNAAILDQLEYDHELA